jgi:hypothetical protein
MLASHLMTNFKLKSFRAEERLMNELAVSPTCFFRQLHQRPIGRVNEAEGVLY